MGILGHDPVTHFTRVRVNDGGVTVADSALVLSSTGALSNVGGIIQANGLTSLTATSINNSGGTIANLSAADSRIVADGAIASQGGTLGGNGAVTLAGQAIDLSQGGRVLAGGPLMVDASGALTANDGGLIQSQGAISLTAGSIDLSRGTLLASTLDAETGNFANNSGLIVSGGPLSLAATGQADNAAGTIESGGTLALTALSLNNASGSITAQGADPLAITLGGTLDNGAQGLIGSRGDLAITAGTLANVGGTLTAMGDILHHGVAQMRVREHTRNFDVEVYGIFWVNGKRNYYAILYPGYEGVTTLTGSECEVTDSKIDHFVLYRRYSGDDMLIHEAAFGNALLDKLIDHQPEAMAEFLRRLEAYKPPSEDHGTEVCPCCGRMTLNSCGCYETCPVCEWIDDPIQAEDPAYPGGENVMSLNEARAAWIKREAE